MRILFLSKTYLFASYLKQLKEIAQLGAEVHLLTPSSWGEKKLEYNFKAEETVSVHLLERYLSGKNHLELYRPGLLRIVKEISPDLIHLDEEPYSLISYQCLRVIKKVEKPFVFFTWQNLEKKIPPPFSIIEKLVHKDSAGAIAGNSEAKEILLKKGYSKLILISPNVGIDTENYKKCDSQELKNKLNLKDKFVLGYVGRLVKEKGIYLLLEAFKQIQNKYSNLVLIYIGSGPEREILKRLITTLKMSEKVFIFDFIYSRELPFYYSLLDLLVLPSFQYQNKILFWKGWKEQFGKVLLEAMSSEVAVIGSSSGEIPQVIGEAGLVFPENDYLDLARKIEMLVNNQQLRKELAEKGRKRVLEKYTCQKIAEQLFDFYQKILYENTY